MFKKIKLSCKAITKIDNWLWFFMDYMHLLRGFVTYRINKRTIKTRAGTIDKSIITEIVLGDKYFPDWLNLDNDAVVIDLGAHIGIFSVLVNRKCYAVEPNTENFELLCKNIEENNADVIPINAAISNTDGKARLYLGRHSARFSLVRKDLGAISQYDPVQTMTLKSLFEKCKIERCNLLKMDIEGAEYQVLYSTPKEIFDKIDDMIFELHDIHTEDKEELFDFLHKVGFDTNLNGEDFVYAHSKSTSKYHRWHELKRLTKCSH